MKTKILNNPKGVGSFVGMLIAALIVLGLYMYIVSMRNEVPGIQDETRNFAQQADIDTSSHTSILNSAITQIEGIEQTNQQREDLFQRYREDHGN